MILVVDASVAVKWVMGGSEGERARGLVPGNVLAAPDLVMAEAANALWRLAGAGHLPEERAAAALAAIERTLHERHPLAPLSARALELACALAHPAYDCFYLALAERLRTQVVTADRRLARSIAATPYAHLVRALA